MPPTSKLDREKNASTLLGKAGKFQAYFKLYEGLSGRGIVHAIQINHPEIPENQYHEGVLVTAELLKANLDKSLAEITADLEARNKQCPTVCGVVDTINVAVQAMIMVDCAARDWHAHTHVMGSYRPTSWAVNESFLGFVERSFPPSLDMDEEAISDALDESNALKAWKLKKRLGIEITPTDNLAHHLLYDPRHNKLYVFHHVAFLKAHLELSADTLGVGCKIKESLKIGTLPPQLLIETLHSLQSIIFPSTDGRSRLLLEQLIRRKLFDSECAEYDGYRRFRGLPEDFTYKYWGDRIVKLNEVMARRVPRNKFSRWLYWQTSDGNALMIALLALLITIVLGVLSLGVACFQTWIAWQAWRSPVVAGS